MKQAPTSAASKYPGRSALAGALLAVLLSFIASVNAADVRHDTASHDIAPNVRGWAIVNIMRFSHWPAAAYPDEEAPTVVCARPGQIILPNDYANAAMPINGRAVLLRESRDLTRIEQCQVVFFSSDDMPVFRQLYAGRADHPVAYVGDTPGFAAEGGSFELILNEDNAFFRFNRAMLVDCGIQLAQSLMRMGGLPSHDDGRQP